MKTYIPMALAIVSLGAFALTRAEEPGGCQCHPMPSFKVAGTDGKTYTQDSLCAKTTVVVFLKAGCPHNAKAAPDLNRFAKQLGPKVAFVGVTDLDVPKAKALVKELKLNFPVLADAKKSIVSGFGATHGLDLAVVCPKDRKVAKVWNGYSATILKEVVASLPEHGGPALKLDLSSYPKGRASGCGF